MYFIQTGYIEVLCKNEIETLIYYGKGSYFGEVGVLITGKRTLSVKSKSDSIVYYIMKDDLLTILDVFP
jgi:CRP-like cAMP-binding protein